MKITTVALVVIVLIVGAIIGAAATSGGASQTITTTATQTITETASVVLTVTSLSAGTALVNYTGSGNANSPPFTATSSTVEVSMNVSSSATSESGVSWYIYPVGSQLYVAQGGVNGQTGQSSSFGYGLTQGQNYYVAILSANANWQIVVQPAQ